MKEKIIIFCKKIKCVIIKIISHIRVFFIKIICGGYKGKIKANGRVKVTNNTFLGNNVNFNGINIEGTGKVIIGNNFHSGKDCLIITDIHNYDKGAEIPYDNTYIKKDVIIEDNVWIGSRVIILGGVTIGEGAIIQAGSVVVKSIPACAIAGGHPARVFNHRDVEHYNQLKIKEKFH